MVAVAAVGLAADKPLAWPQFRGPNGSGVADDQKPPVEFGPDKNVKWKVPAPSGLSSPIVAGDKLVLTAFDDGKLYTIAYHRADGKEAWRTEAPAKEIETYFKGEGSPAASTPATDGERIVSYFGSCGLFCYDLAGKELWKYELPTAETMADFGTGTSPIIADGLVVLVRDEAKDPKIIALDAATGSLKWEKPRQSPVSYGTPVVWDGPGGKQVVAAGHGRMIAYDLKTGRREVVGGRHAVRAVHVAGGGRRACCSSPAGRRAGRTTRSSRCRRSTTSSSRPRRRTRTSSPRRRPRRPSSRTSSTTMDTNKDGKITRDEWDAVLKFMAEGKNSAFAVKAGGTGDVTKSHVLWTKTKGLPYVPSGIVYRGQFVMVKDGGMVTAYDAKTGKDVYAQERELANGKYYASPVAANGHIYFTSLEDGTVTVLKAGAAKPEVVAKNPKLGERVAATPAIADDTLYVRTAGHLYAFAAKK